MPKRVYIGTWSPDTCSGCSVVRVWTDDPNAPKDHPMEMNGVPGFIVGVGSFPRVPGHPQGGEETGRRCGYHEHLSDPHEHLVGVKKENDKKNGAWNSAVEHLGVEHGDIGWEVDGDRVVHLTANLPGDTFTKLRFHLNSLGHSDVLLHHKEK